MRVEHCSRTVREPLQLRVQISIQYQPKTLRRLATIKLPANTKNEPRDLNSKRFTNLSEIMTIRKVSITTATHLLAIIPNGIPTTTSIAPSPIFAGSCKKEEHKRIIGRLIITLSKRQE